jgi:PAS domain S-box-containing protein
MNESQNNRPVGIKYWIEQIRRMAVILRDSNDAVTVFSPEGNIISWNKGASRMYGYDEDEALSMSIYQIVPDERKKETFDLIRRIKNGETVESSETKRITKDGRVLDVWLTVTALRDDRDELIGIATTARDITRQKQMERQLRRMAVILQDSNDAVTVFSPQGDITSWNKGAVRMYGYNEDEALSMSVLQIVPGERRKETLDLIERIKNGETIESFETKRITKDGRVLDVWLTITALKDEQNNLTDIATTERDITQLKASEVRLKRQADELAEANRELESFSYSVAHDLQTPLRSIATLIDLLVSDYSKCLDKDALELLERITNGIRRMDAIIGDLLSLSRVTRKEMLIQEINLSTLAVTIVNELRQLEPQRNVKVSIEDNLVIRGDQGLFKIALSNLLGNAWKYTAKTPNPMIEFGCIDKDNQVFFIRDNGVGFNMEKYENLFLPFKRLHPESQFPGTGIGLSIVSKILKRHRGEIWAEGQEGKGATFYFTVHPESKH